jgi:hypothetical protein
MFTKDRFSCPFLPVPADNTRLALTPFLKFQRSRDFANPNRYLLIAGILRNFRRDIESPDESKIEINPIFGIIS